jgi:hypothetical protein
MATWNTTLFTQQQESRSFTISGNNVASSPSRLAPDNVASGEVEFAVIPYTLVGSGGEAANDIINLGLLPAGAIPLPHLSKCICAADPGTALTVEVGTAASATGYAAAVAMTVQGEVPFCLAGGTMPGWLAQTPIVPDTGSGNAVVFATITTATALTAGVVVYFVLAYKRGR